MIDEMNDQINSRLNFNDGTGLKTIMVETTAELVKMDKYENLQNFLDQTSQVKTIDGVVMIKDSSTGQWVELKVPGTDEPVEDVPTIPAPPLGNVTGLTATVSGDDITVKWTDPNDVTVIYDTNKEIRTIWQSTKLVYKVGSIPVDVNDGILAVENTVRNQYSIDGYTVSGLPKDQLIYFKAFPTDTAGAVLNSDDNAVSAKIISFSDDSGTPGPTTLKGGDKSAGFFGEVPNTELITPVELAAKIGLTEGTSYNEDTPWLKFICDGRVLFTPKKPIRNNLSWDSIDAVNAVYGTNIIQVNGKYYKVRLFKGALTDPYSSSATDQGAKGSEWNRLMLPIHAQAKDSSWTYPAYVDDNVSDWGIGYTDSDLLTSNAYGDGSYTWCQEAPSENSSTRLGRGHDGVSSSIYGTSSNANTARGWRPVLEYIPDSEIDDTTGSPGSLILKAGDKSAGFFGEVPNDQLITPVNLSLELGLTAGTSYNEDTPWLKFICDGKILFISKKPIRSSISWSAIDAVGAAYGDSTIQVNGITYKVRLIRGAITNPYDSDATDKGAKGSEWNRLILPIHAEASDKSWKHPSNVEDDLPDWGIGYTDTDLLTSNSAGGGYYTLCQETASAYSNYRCIRGGVGIANSSTLSIANTSGAGWRPVLEIMSEEDKVDTTGSPGSQALRAGDTSAGFFGEVPSAKFITPATLTSTVGITTGIASNTDTPWLKFILDGKILFTTKKPIRYKLSWDVINAANAVYGTKTIQVSDKTYKVRLFKGVISDPYSNKATDHGAKGSEWNRLMLPIHTQASDKSWGYPAYVEDDAPNWGIRYTDADLITSMSSGNGSGTWCQETPSEYATGRTTRGTLGVSYASSTDSNLTNVYHGWRPVLELVPEEEVADKSGSPGSSMLKAGDKSAGFFGEVPNAQFITPTTLASTIGLTAGTSANTTSPWLKFILDGKILFTTKKPIRHTISWDQINAVGAAKGTKTIQVSGKTYKVRLFKASTADPYSNSDADKGTKGSEWNRLMLPINIKAKDKSWRQPAFVEDNASYWGIDYSDSDLTTVSSQGNGSYTWCQETSSTTQANRAVRGFYDAASFDSLDGSYPNSICGWRPVLELVE